MVGGPVHGILRFGSELSDGMFVYGMLSAWFLGKADCIAHDWKGIVKEGAGHIVVRYKLEICVAVLDFNLYRYPAVHS